MKKYTIENIQKSLENLTKKWWFFLLLFIISFIPTYASKGVDPQKTLEVMKEVFSNPLILSIPILMPISKLITIFMIIAIILFKNKITRAFNIFVVIITIGVAIFQHSAFTETYGFVVISGNLTIILVVALFWIWEIIVKKNDLTPQKQPLWKWWLVPLAILAFWYPVDMNTITPDFSILYIFTNESVLTYCMFTPVVLAILTIYHPYVNIAVFRVTSYVGLIFGIINIVTWFIINPMFWWMGILHIPLFLISLYAFIISFLNKLKSTTQN